MSRQSRGVFRRAFQHHNENRHSVGGAIARALKPSPPPATCKTAADMTAEEIAALEKQYNAKLRR